MVVFAGIYPYTTPNSFEFGDQDTSCIGPSLSVVDRQREPHLWCYCIATKLDSRIKASIGAQDVHVGLSIVTLVALVHFGLREHNNACAFIVPLKGDFVAFEESLLGHWRAEVRYSKHLH